MDKILARLDKAITDLSARSDELQSRQAAAKERIERLQSEIPSVQAAIQRAFVDGSDILALDRHRRELKEELETNQIGLAGLAEELDRIENELSTAIERRNSRFAELAQAWLTKEGASFNSLVDKLRAEAKRLFAAKQLLTDMGDVSTFAESLGSGANYLHQIVLPTLCNGFVASDLQGDRQKARLRPTTSLCQEIFEEIMR